MSQERIAYLLQQYHTEKITLAERQELADLLGNAGNDQLIAAALQRAMQEHIPTQSYLDRDYSALLQKIVSVDQPAVQTPGKSIHPVRWWRWVAAAAIVLAIAGAGYRWYTYNERVPATHTPAIAMAKDIAPG